MNNIHDKILCVIPARGGSKGIKNKNLANLNGHPLIYWSLKEAKKTNLINKIYVSTDCKKIKKYALSQNVSVVDRPKKISGDNATSESALLHTLSQKNVKEFNPEILVFLQCTSPLITYKNIEKGLKFLIKNKLDSTFASVLFHGFLWKKKADKFSGINHLVHDRVMRQQFDKQYLEAGSIYIMKVDIFKKNKSRFCGNFAPFTIKYKHYCDIDNIDDIRRAYVLKRYFNKHDW